MRRSLAPGTAIVDEEAVGQPVALEGRDQVGAHGRPSARVVVEDGEGMAAPRAAGPAGVHLRALGCGCSLEGPRLVGPLRRDPRASCRRRGDGGGRRGWTPWRANSTRSLRAPHASAPPVAVRAGLWCGRRERCKPCAPSAAYWAPSIPKRSVGPRLPRQGHKLSPQVTHASLRKWHILVLLLIAGCVNHVSERV